MRNTASLRPLMRGSSGIPYTSSATKMQRVRLECSVSAPSDFSSVDVWRRVAENELVHYTVRSRTRYRLIYVYLSIYHGNSTLGGAGQLTRRGS